MVFTVIAMLLGSFLMFRMSTIAQPASINSTTTSQLNQIVVFYQKIDDAPAAEDISGTAEVIALDSADIHDNGVKRLWPNTPLRYCFSLGPESRFF